MVHITQTGKPLEPRRIAHLDMDAFYASVELLRRPQLHGKPVIVGGCGHPLGRGVVTTCSYEARTFGVHSGMPMRTAARLCRDAVFLPVDFEEYRRLSKLFKSAILTVAPVMEDRGIDEVYLDLTEHEEPTRGLSQSIKDAVKNATGLTCSIGVAPNKLIAKIASELEKPDGLSIIRQQDIPPRIWPLAVKKINGIGPKASDKLLALGIETIGQLAATRPELLNRYFGAAYGKWLHQAGNGIDHCPVITYSEPKSRSRETTFERDLHPVQDAVLLAEITGKLCNQVGSDLSNRGYVGKTVGIKIRFDNFQSITRDSTLPAYTNNSQVIRKAVFACLRRVSLERPIRLLGVKVSNLLHESQHIAFAEPQNLSLF
jgi:DNA polymerase-4